MSRSPIGEILKQKKKICCQYPLLSKIRLCTPCKQSRESSLRVKINVREGLTCTVLRQRATGFPSSISWQLDQVVGNTIHG